MKKRAFAIFAAAVIGLAASLSAPAQMPENLMQPLPIDPEVVIGHLDNGLTYYIRHNAIPAGRAEFYLATNVGAIQEAPDQDGLAHFLEHMCFNGTEHFPDKGILDYLRSIGAEFGRNINASTGFEETQYMLNNIPVERESVVDTCLMILCDYAHFVMNDPVEIDKERGVIIEERRQRRNASWRTMEMALPYYFGEGTRMAGCTLIGRQESLETFAPESLTNFYHTWYHPDMQAVVVIGDVDVERTAQKIQEIFSVIPAEPNPAQKFVPQVEINANPVVGVITDPEATAPSIEMLWRSPAPPEMINNTFVGQMQDLVEELVGSMMRERFRDITSRPDTPFISGFFTSSDLIYESISADMGDVQLKEDNIIGGFKAFYTELQRMKRFGFTEDEFARAKDRILSSLDAARAKADTRRNPEFVRPILQNFFDNDPILTPEDEYTLAENIFSRLNAQMLSQVASMLLPQEGLVILYSGPEKEGIRTPSAEEILAAKAEVEASDIQPLTGETVATEFISPASLKGAKICKSAKTVYGATRLTLKNGMDVVLLPTDNTKDQILFDIYKLGGKSLVETEDLDSFDSNVFNLFLSNSGIAGFSNSQTRKMLTGKNISVEPYVDDLEHGVSGQSTVKDFETALQLVYLYFTQPRFDEDEFQTGIGQLRAVLPNILSQPNFAFQTEMMNTLYGGNPRQKVISMETLDKANLPTVEKYWKQLFSTAKGATMVIVGDFDIEKVKPLVTKYIGSIPKGKKALGWVDRNETYAQGEIINVFGRDMQTPKSTTIQVYNAPMTYSQDNVVALDVARYILNMRYTNSLREDEGGTYGASTAGTLEREPRQEALFQVYFDSRPSVTDRLRELAINDMKALAESGPTAEEMNQAVLNLKKNIPENRQRNAYWRGCLEDFLRYGDDRDAAYEAAVNSITAEKVRSVMQQIVSSGNIIEVVMKPANTAESE